MKTVFIVNPHAGTENNAAKLRSAIQALDEASSCELYVTQEAGDATRFVERWTEKHPGEKVRFVACGGDGTVNEVFNGAVGKPNVSVSCYPCGSGNDFVKAFGGAERFMDVGKLITVKTQ